MLTVEESRWSLSAFKIFSILNILPIGVDVKSGKIQRQSNRVKFFLWKFLFGVGVSHWLYIFWRLLQSTTLDLQKYFRWDHFVLHFGFVLIYVVFYFTGFRLFVTNAEENVLIFNQLFEERENPVQKMIEQQLEMNRKSRNGKPGNSASGSKIRGKSDTRLVSTSAGETHEENQNEVIENPSESEVLVYPRPLLTWPPQYSLDELLAKLLPSVILFSGVCAILFLAIDPTRPQLLYSALPPEYQNSWSFLTLLSIEAFCLVIAFFTGGFSNVAQLLFFGKCHLEFQRINLQFRSLQEKFQNPSPENGGRDIERELWILRQILEEMRELVVFIELFNRCFPFPIFAFKIMSLSLCIMLYFFVIRHFQEFPVLAVFIAYSAMFCTLTYAIMYERAFSIPGKMEELKKEFLLTAQKTRSKSNANSNGDKNLPAELTREVKRIRVVGIKVGSFHQMERESTPNFIDFVFRQVVTLLVTFPR